MKTLILCTLLLIATLPIKAQQALAKYQQAMGNLANQPNSEEKSAQKGKNLAIFFDERKQEAGAETAFAETHKLLQELKVTDFYAAFYVLMKVKDKGDMTVFGTTDFTSHEQEVIRNKLSPYIINKIMSKGNPPNYPDGVPLPGYSWSNATASTSTTTQRNTPPPVAVESPTKTVVANQSGNNTYTDNGQADFETATKALQTNNYTKALKWFREAAHKGNVAAMYKTAELYTIGMGNPVDYFQARWWYEKAANKGNILAMYKLGEIYADGIYVKKDTTQAIKWYNKAIQTGDGITLGNYQTSCYKCKGTGKLVSQTRIPGTGGAIIGQSVTQSNATTISGGTTTVTTRYSSPTYETSTYTCEDCKGTGTVTLKETMPSGYVDALIALAFVTGQTEFEKATAQYKISDKERDFKKAFKLYQNAADKGHTQAMYGLGTMYRNGQGVKKDDALALQWFKKAAEKGDKSAEEAVKELSGGSPKSQ